MTFNGFASSSPSSVGLDYCPNFPNVAGSQSSLTLELHHDDLTPITDSTGKTISNSITFTAVESADQDAGPVGGACGTSGNPITLGASHMFGPADCPVTAGETVNWLWTSDTHSVTSDPGAAASFDSGLIPTGTDGHFSFTIPAGTASGTVIHYHCNNHAIVTNGVCSGMCATLTVQ